MTDQPRRKLRPLRDEITDLPNLITLARIALIPAVLAFTARGGPGMAIAACSLFLLGAATDWLDGWLARRMGLVTVLGKFLDPLADKLIVLSTLVILVGAGRAPAWLTVLLMSRELAVTGLRAIASQEGLVIAAGTSGKIKTVMQLAGIALLLAHYPIELGPVTIDCHQIGTWIVYASLVMSLLSAVEYFRFFADAAARQAEVLAAEGITRAELKARARQRRAQRRQQRRASKLERREQKRAARADRKRGGTTRGPRRGKRRGKA
ncbi:MAG: CDP-diacylglycerol--glycerol-3-phosphate 3-phosphatidyltransferase [Deltaproteobacteria bacterium]|nr:CDP-diacylglycerol--glycerol-3-phosphate 3-phosphatidyltransferase [Deltaproteobacteria bacterium]